jgi:uncharacterized protein YciI
VIAETAGVEFFCYHRDRPGSMVLREELLAKHWSYMDRYQAEMIARGPTLAGDGGTATGSVHILGLPGPAAARAFAFDEPNYQAGVYRDVLLRRWRNLLGRTMWDFPGGRDGGNRYLVLGLGTGQAADLAPPPGQDELIAYGPLLSDDGAAWLGTAVLLRAPGPDAARAVLTAGRYAVIEVHRWQFGGRALVRRSAHRNRESSGQHTESSRGLREPESVIRTAGPARCARRAPRAGARSARRRPAASWWP